MCQKFKPEIDFKSFIQCITYSHNICLHFKEKEISRQIESPCRFFCKSNNKSFGLCCFRALSDRELDAADDNSVRSVDVEVKYVLMMITTQNDNKDDDNGNDTRKKKKKLFISPRLKCRQKLDNLCKLLKKYPQNYYSGKKKLPYIKLFKCIVVTFTIKIILLNFTVEPKQNDSIFAGKSSQLGKRGFSSLQTLTWVCK